MKQPLQIENYLSSWIFVWAVIYLIARHLKNPQIASTLQYCNPAFGLCVALFWQILAGILIVFRFDSQVPIILAKYAILTTLFKSGPLWLTVRQPVPWLYSALAFFVIFTFYVAFIQYKRLNLFVLYDDLMDSFVSDDNRVPPYKWTIDLLHKIYKH